MDTYHYLIRLQYLGFRFHGWQKQPGVKTIEEMLERTVRYVLGKQHFKLLGASRTDAMVSAEETLTALFLREKIDTVWFLDMVNVNLPADLRLLEVRETDASFNIIQSPRRKEYHYYFCFGGKMHPYCAPFMTCVAGILDLEAMTHAADIFTGRHNFRNYCVQPSPKTKVNREVVMSEIGVNTNFTASFFPEKTYVYRVAGPGFLRQQIRSMMGALFLVGKGEWRIEDVRRSLGNEEIKGSIAPASGLHLYQFDI